MYLIFRSVLILVGYILVISNNCFSQDIFKRKNKKIIITHSYSFFVYNSDSIRYGRTFEIELDKLSGIANLKLNVIQLESMLNDKQMGAKGYELSFNQMIDELRLETLKYNVSLNLGDYENEFHFYQNHKIKSKAELEQESYKERLKENEEKRKIGYQLKKEEEQKLKQRDDSIAIIKLKEKHINDSIEDLNYRVEMKRQAAQEKIKRKAQQQKALKESKERQEKEKLRFSELISKYGSRNAELIFNKKVKIGWTKEMCIASWGKPKDVNRTTTDDYFGFNDPPISVMV